MNGFLKAVVLMSVLLKSVFHLSATLSVPSSLTHERRAKLDEAYHGTIPLMNKGEEALLVKVSLVDYRYNSKGESFFETPLTHERSNASWITLSHEYLQIPAHSTVQVSYKVHIPNDASLKGTYWSMILIEPSIQQAALPSEENSIGLQTIVRYGIQLVSQIADTGYSDVKILNKSLAREAGKIWGSFEVENCGSSFLDPLLKIDVFDMQGKFVAHFLGNKLRILPNCSVKYDIELSDLMPGDYKTMIILDSGEKGVFGAEYDLKI